MTKREDGGPAFPVHGGYDGDDPRNGILGGGMTLRDWFAGQALPGVVRQCANDLSFGMPDGISSIEELFARNSYRIADAMLKAREVPHDQA